MKVSSCDYYKIFKNNFLYRTPPVAALHLELNIYMVKMAKILATKSICLNFPRTVNKTHTDRAILKFSTQPEKKCFSQAFKSGNCKKKRKNSYTCVPNTTCFPKWFLLHAITGTFLIHVITGRKLLKSKKSLWKTPVKEFILTDSLFSMIFQNL